MTQYIRNSKTISGRLHDELVIMDLSQRKYFSLNPVAIRIWDLLEKPVAVKALSMALLDEYSVDPERGRIEVEEHLADMLKNRAHSKSYGIRRLPAIVAAFIDFRTESYAYDKINGG